MSAQTQGTHMVPVNESHAVAQAPQQAGLIDIGGGVGATLSDALALAHILRGATTLPDHYRSEANIATAVLKAAQMRVPLMAVIEGTFFVKGKVGLGADLMVAAVRGSGLLKSWSEDCNDQRATIKASRTDGSGLEVTFGEKEAKTAGLCGGNYDRFRTDMFRARAASRVCRRLFPDVLAGSYSVDELQDAGAPDPTVDTDTGEILDEQPAAAPHSDPQTVRYLMGCISHADTLDALDEARAAATQALRSGKLTKDGTAAASIKAAISKRRTELTQPETDADEQVPALSDPAGPWLARIDECTGRSHLNSVADDLFAALDDGSLVRGSDAHRTVADFYATKRTAIKAPVSPRDAQVREGLDGEAVAE